MREAKRFVNDRNILRSSRARGINYYATHRYNIEQCKINNSSLPTASAITGVRSDSSSSFVHTGCIKQYPPVTTTLAANEKTLYQIHHYYYHNNVREITKSCIAR